MAKKPAQAETPETDEPVISEATRLEMEAGAKQRAANAARLVEAEEEPAGDQE